MEIGAGMDRAVDVGWLRRIQRLFGKTGRAVVVPVDDLLLAGPTGFLSDPTLIAAEISEGKPDGVLGFSGFFRQHHAAMRESSLIMNLSASTTRSRHTRKVAVASVEEAIRVAADLVAVHINVSSEFEGEMLELLGEVVDTCRPLGIPVMAISYARSEGAHGDENYHQLRATAPQEYIEIAAHAVRVAVELGADVIKTQFKGDSSGVRQLVTAAGNVPVLLAGGPLVELQDALRRAVDAMNGGAAGISFGRNVFQRQNCRKMIRALKHIVHEQGTLDSALAIAGAIE